MTIMFFQYHICLAYYSCLQRNEVKYFAMFHTSLVLAVAAFFLSSPSFFEKGWTQVDKPLPGMEFMCITFIHSSVVSGTMGIWWIVWDLKMVCRFIWDGFTLC